MQTFLPYEDFYKSLDCLDSKRLGKQRVEAFQIIGIIKAAKNNPSAAKKMAWYNHPATQMWIDNLDSLILYYNISLQLWAQRGYKNEKLQPIDFSPISIQSPKWLGHPKFHASHRAALLYKYYFYYMRYDWKEQPREKYFWPTEHSKEILHYHFQKRVEKKKKHANDATSI